MTTVELLRVTMTPEDVAAIRKAKPEARAARAAKVVRASLEWPEDLTDVAAMAAEIAREAKKLSGMARSRRDMAGLVMIKPFQLAQRPYDAAMERIDAALESGKIDAHTANVRREKARAKRREAMVGVVYKPIQVYRDTIGVSKGLFVRMQHRETQELPEFRDPETGEPMTLEQVKELGLAARAECEMYDAIDLGACTIRDEAVHVLLNGDPKRGIKAISNADVSRIVGLTTARVAQLRYGTR
jgi:hypothetical protein